MCNYCEKEENIICYWRYEDYAGYEDEYEINLHIENDKILIDGEEAKINFCPMCGEELECQNTTNDITDCEKD